MKTKNINSLLVEVLLAMLFFALSATVILQVFVTARTESDRAQRMSQVLFAAQNLADETYLAEHPEDTTITLEDGTVLTVTVSEEMKEAGTFRNASVTAVDTEGKTLLTLPCSRYIPGAEVVQ